LQIDLLVISTHPHKCSGSWPVVAMKKSCFAGWRARYC
jgi:hypothetical protein